MVYQQWQLTEGVRCSTSRSILPTPVSGWDGDSKGSIHLHIVWVLTHSDHSTGTFSTRCCHVLYTGCWGDVDLITVNIKPVKVLWSHPVKPDDSISSPRGSFSIHSNIQWSGWYLCHRRGNNSKYKYFFYTLAVVFHWLLCNTLSYWRMFLGLLNKSCECNSDAGIS